MNTKITGFIFSICVYVGIGGYANAKNVALPFDQYVDLSSLVITAEASPSPAVPAERFLSGLLADCRDFKTRMQRWQDQKAQISDELYHEIRTMPNALSMLEKFEVTAELSEIINQNVKKEIAERFTLSDVRSKIKLSFGPSSLTPEKYRSDALSEVEYTTGFAGGGNAVKFKTRDVFCDVLSGAAKISLSGELAMVPRESFRLFLRNKLAVYAEAFSLVNEPQMKDAVRAILFGAALYNLQGKPEISVWRNEFEKNFKYIFDSTSFRPHPFWFLQVDDRFVAGNLDQIPLGLSEIDLKLRGQNEL